MGVEEERNEGGRLAVNKKYLVVSFEDRETIILNTKQEAEDYINEGLSAGLGLESFSCFLVTKELELDEETQITISGD